MSRQDEKILERAKDRYLLADEDVRSQRQREQEDLEFQIPEKQWTDAARKERAGSAFSPARPILSVSRIEQPIQLIVNQQKSSHLGVRFTPTSVDAADEMAEIIRGIYRKMERDSQAAQARNWAFERAVKAGTGVYRIGTRFCQTNDWNSIEAFDQEFEIKRVLYQQAVRFDPAAQEPDFSDGEFAFVGAWFRRSDFEDMFPDSEAATSDSIAWESLLAREPRWVRGKGKDAGVFVVEYFYKEHDKSEILLLDGGKIVREEEYQGKSGAVRGRREWDNVIVRTCKISGFDILEKGDWNGQYIPLVPVFGCELQPFDDERRWIGLIRNARDSQRIYNYAASNAVEITGLEPKVPWVGVEGQFAGHEVEWNEANVRNRPYLQYRMVDYGGQPAPPPQRAQIDVGRLGPTMMLLQLSDQQLQVTTQTFDPSLGRTSDKERSGIAIQSLQNQSESATSGYIHSLATISMAYEARVILDALPRVYDRPGRIARTLSLEDSTDMVMLNEPFYVDRQTKMPVPVAVRRDEKGKPILPLTPLRPITPDGVPPGMPPEGMPEGGSPEGMPEGMSGVSGSVPQQVAPPPPQPKLRYYDLSVGVYTIAVDIGKTRQTALQEGAEEIGQLIKAVPEIMTVIGPDYLEYRDFPGARQMADKLAKLRDVKFPGLVGDSKNDELTPSQAHARIAALQKQITEMKSALEQAVKLAEVEHVKQSAMLQKAAMDNSSRESIAAMEQQTKVLIETMQNEFKQLESILRRGHEAKTQQFDAAIDAAKTVTAQQAAQVQSGSEIDFGSPSLKESLE